MFLQDLLSLLLLASPAVLVAAGAAAGPAVDVFYRRCFVLGVPGVAKVFADTVFPTAVEVSSDNGVSNIPGIPALVGVPSIVDIPAVVGSLLLLASLLLLLYLLLIKNLLLLVILLLLSSCTCLTIGLN